MAGQGMIQPFEPSLVRQIEVDSAAALRPVISYGLSSYGYDIRLSPAEFRIFRHIPGTVIDPKNFNPKNLELTTLQTDNNGDYFILPAHSYGLGVALEKLQVPHNISVICIGKSTYARCFRGDTAIALVDGTAATLEQMADRAERGEQFWGYSVNRDGRVIVSLLEQPRYIGRDALLKLTLDNHQSILCTPDHCLMTRSGRMTPAHELCPNDSLMPLYRQLAHDDKSIYERVYQPLNGRWSPTHHLSHEWNLRHGVYPNTANGHLRHFDHNRLNNKPANLTRSNASEPSQRHHDLSQGDDFAPDRHRQWIEMAIAKLNQTHQWREVFRKSKRTMG